MKRERERERERESKLVQIGKPRLKKRECENKIVYTVKIR